MQSPTAICLSTFSHHFCLTKIRHILLISREDFWRRPHTFQIQFWLYFCNSKQTFKSLKFCTREISFVIKSERRTIYRFINLPTNDRPESAMQGFVDKKKKSSRNSQYLISSTALFQSKEAQFVYYYFIDTHTGNGTWQLIYITLDWCDNSQFPVEILCRAFKM